jgi:NADPH2:quinone reductase
MASRTPPTPVEPGALIGRSRAVIGFWLAHCARRPRLLREPVAELLAMVADGSLRTVDGGSYPLADARRAHEDIRSRRTAGKLTLTP